MQLFGENGLLKKAKHAVDTYEDSSRIEELDMMLLGYAMDLDTDQTLDSFLESRVGHEIDDSFKMAFGDDESNQKNIVEKDGYYYSIEEDENGGFKVEGLDQLDGKKVDILTQDKFDSSNDEHKGEMVFDSEAGGLLAFGEEVRGEFCFDIKKGIVDIYVDYDMTLTNKGLTRSAINIDPGATLNLHVKDGVTLTVDSGMGQEGHTANGLGASGGPRRLCRDTSAMDR